MALPEKIKNDSNGQAPSERTSAGFSAANLPYDNMPGKRHSSFYVYPHKSRNTNNDMVTKKMHFISSRIPGLTC